MAQLVLPLTFVAQKEQRVEALDVTEQERFVVNLQPLLHLFIPVLTQQTNIAMHQILVLPVQIPMHPGQQVPELALQTIDAVKFRRHIPVLTQQINIVMHPILALPAQIPMHLGQQVPELVLQIIDAVKFRLLHPAPQLV